MHSTVGVYIKECDWQSLGKQLYRDLRELKSIFGDEEYKQT